MPSFPPVLDKLTYAVMLALRTILTGNAGKVLRVDNGGTGFQVTPASTSSAGGTIPISNGGGKLDSWVSDADATTQGKVQLANDLGGTASAPTVVAGHFNGTQLTLGAVADGQLLARSGTSVVGVAIGVAVQAYNAILSALAALSTTGLIARTGSGTVATRTITAADIQALLTNGDGVSGNPTIGIDPGYMSAAYHWYGMATDGVTLSGSNGVVTFSNSTTFTINGTNNIPEAQITASTITTQGVRTNAQICTLSQGMTHRYSIVTGSVKTLVRWRIGLALATSLGTALKPGGVVAMVVFDPDSGQTNATTNWYLLTYDNGGGAVSYTDTTVACNVSTAYEIEIVATTSLVSARVRTSGGTWSSAVSTSTSLPASGTAMNACCFLNPTAANARALQFRKWSAWVQY